MIENNQQDFAAKALAYARAVANMYPRGSATGGEARAAEYVRKQLEGMGIKNVQSQSFQGLRSIWLFLSLAFGLALVGHAAYWLLRSSLGVLPAVLVSLVCFGWSSLLLWRKFTFRSVPLVQSLPHGPSQNVLAVLPPAGEVRHKVVLVAHLDSHRAVWLFANDFLVRLYALSSQVSLYVVAAAPVIYVLAELANLPWIGYAGGLLALIHFVGWFTGMTADLGMYSPGANDNASSLGTLLGLAEHLQRQPPQHTEIWLAFTGCDETGCDGMRALLAEHGPRLKEAIFIDFELVGIGERLAYLRSEGMLRKRRIASTVEEQLKAAAEDFPLDGINAAGIGAFTEIGAVWEHGYSGACVLVHRTNEALIPEWHRLTDRGERLQAGAFQLIHEFAWKLLSRIDSDA